MPNAEELYASSKRLQSGLGATVWAVLEGVRRGQATEDEVKIIEELCKKYFPKLTNDECNAICEVLERRLLEDKEGPGRWYSEA